MPRSLKFQYGNRKTSGFTLLELLLVVFIMSVLAFSAVSLTNTMDSSQDQYRYERAKNQAVGLKKAIIDRVDGQEVVSGFVADMGDLPDNMTELAFGVKDGDPDDVFPENQSIAPRFDPTPGVDFYENSSGDEFALLLGFPSPVSTSLNLRKGYRGLALQTNEGTPRNFYMGGYLSLKPGKNIYEGLGKPRFDDGWGNVSPANSYTKRESYTIPASNAFGDDELTHGWEWAFPDNVETSLIISSYGKNGEQGGTDYDEDLVLATIHEDDWSVDSTDVHVELQNDVFEVERDCSDLRALLLVYNAKINKWRSIPSLNFGSSPGNGFSRIAFPAGLRIPAGTHVLLLNRESNSRTTPLALADEVQAGDENSTQPEIQRLLFAPDSRLIKYKLQVTLPDPDDLSNSVTYINDAYDLLPLSTKISELNTKFRDGGVGVGEYDSDPLEYVASDNTIKLDAAAATTAMTNNRDFANIQILFDPTDANNVLIRAKHINILPGQTNVLQINLSSTVQPQP